MSILTKIAKAPKKEITDISVLVGNVFSKLYGNPGKVVLNKIDKKLSWFMDGAQFSKAFRNDVWDGYIRLFSTRTQIFPTGYLPKVLKILDKKKVNYGIKDVRKAIDISPDSIKKAIKFSPKMQPRPYQVKALKRALRLRSGVVNIPTGSGKTLIINLIIKAIDLHTASKLNHTILTSGISLLSQLKEEISKFQKIKIGFIGEGMWEQRRITVASVDTLYSHLSNPNKLSKDKKKAKEAKLRANRAKNFLAASGSVFLDEAHHSPAKTFKSVIYKTANASFRYGTTALYKRSGNDEMLLHAVTGNVIFRRSLSWMIDNGYLAKPTIILMEYEGKDLSDDEWHDEYKSGISANLRRNRLLAKISTELYKRNLSQVLFVTEKKQGEGILAILEFEHNFPVNKASFLTGADDQVAVRKPVLNKFCKGNIKSIICTRILNEGIDFPEANAGIRCGAQKFEGSIIQQLGRLLRKVKNPYAKDIDRNEMQRIFWVDLCDMHSPRLATHSLKRIETYESEEAFEVKYVSSLRELRRVLDGRIKEAKIIKQNKKNPHKKK